MLGRVEPEQLKSDLTMPWAHRRHHAGYAGCLCYRLHNFR